MHFCVLILCLPKYVLCVLLCFWAKNTFLSQVQFGTLSDYFNALWKTTGKYAYMYMHDANAVCVHT